MVSSKAVNPVRACVYVRISSDPQGLRAGVERQEADCRALAQQRDWQVVEVDCDNDVSANNGNPRPGYRKMIQDIDHVAVDAVVTWHLDGSTAVLSSPSTSSTSRPGAGPLSRP